MEQMIGKRTCHFSGASMQLFSGQRGRWYNTAAVLADGSVLIIGGETGSNGPPQPNLEMLPKPVDGDTVVTLDWLARTYFRFQPPTMPLGKPSRPCSLHNGSSVHLLLNGMERAPCQLVSRILQVV